MKTKLKLIGVVLLCCVLVLAFTACAGCTSTTQSTIPSKTNTPAEDPIIGTWKHVTPNGHTHYLEFRSDGTQIQTLQNNDGFRRFTFDWIKVGDNHYQDPDVYDDFYLSEDGTQLSYTWSTTLTGEQTDVYVRASHSEVPTDLIYAG